MFNLFELYCLAWFAYTCTVFAHVLQCTLYVQHCLAPICIYTLCICTHFVLYLYCLAWICIHRLPGWVPVRPGGKVNSWPDMNSNWAPNNISSNLFWIDIVRCHLSIANQKNEKWWKGVFEKNINLICQWLNVVVGIFIVWAHLSTYVHALITLRRAVYCKKVARQSADNFWAPVYFDQQK